MVRILHKSETRIYCQKNGKTIVYIDKCRYEIKEHKEVPVWYTGIFKPSLGTGVLY
jgi:hypothetical protein